MKNKVSATVKIPNGTHLEAPVRIYSGVRVKNKVSIGAFTFIGINTVLENNTSIGKYCSIAADVKIGVHPHPIDYLSTHPFQYNEAHFDFIEEYNDRDKVVFKKPGITTIGNDVWIGTNVTISKGVKIGDGAVVAAHSFVKHDVPPYSIVGGVPSKIIRYRFDAESIAKLLTLKWWELKPWELNGIDFRDVDEAINSIEGLKLNAEF